LPARPAPPAYRPACVPPRLPPRPLQPTIYQSRLLGFFGTFANECSSADRAAFVECLLTALVELSYAKDHTARWRACQLLHALVSNIPPEAELSDEVWDAFQDAMLERLEDGKPVIRAVAVRTLARLPDPGNDGDFAGCQLTATLIDMLAAEKSKAVRKAVLATLPCSEFTRAYFMQRTRDEADDVSAARVLCASWGRGLGQQLPLS
jgi:condensin complex subunit 3